MNKILKRVENGNKKLILFHYCESENVSTDLVCVCLYKIWKVYGASANYNLLSELIQDTSSETYNIIRQKSVMWGTSTDHHLIEYEKQVIEALNKLIAEEKE